MSARVIHGDCLNVMPTLDANSVDAIVCDPPYHLTTGKRGGTGRASLNPDSPAGRSRIGTGFMGKAWDGGDVAFRVETWEAALRVAKPGAHLVAFGGTRTFHRLTCAIEDAGWEIRDCLSWLYGSGFPKSLDVSKAIDKAAGLERAVVGYDATRARPNRATKTGPVLGEVPYDRSDNGATITAPSSDAARSWDGWGTALKPAWEPIILARKPFPSTVAANVLRHSTGALNIDGCRIKFANPGDQAAAAAQRSCRDQNENRSAYGRFENGEASLAPYLAQMDKGRWPANVCLDEEAAQLLDEASGTLHSGDAHILRRGGTTGKGMGYGSSSAGNVLDATYGDTGGASRFFYTAKASASERHAGVTSAPRQRDEQREPDLPGGNNPRNRGASSVANSHPTVKPLALMQWLCRLVTPKGGLILDPFCGSGSTGRAAVAEGFNFIGIELDAEYAEIARARIADYAPLFAEGA